jgi:hypothetical protein
MNRKYGKIICAPAPNGGRVGARGAIVSENEVISSVKNVKNPGGGSGATETARK